MTGMKDKAGREKTQLIVPLIQPTVTAMRAGMSEAAAAGADMVEARIDYLSDTSDEALRRLLTDPPRPVIVTCRSSREGGRGDVDDVARAQVLARAARLGATYVDFELAGMAAAGELLSAIAPVDAPPDDARARLIVSAHDFERCPADLAGIVGRMDEGPGHVNKIAFAARGPEDGWAAFDVLRGSRKPAIALAMGECGLASRILAGKFGAFGTFAALAAGDESAPGQPTIAELRGLYRWDAIGPDTKVYGVVGCPVGHSMSPAIHNAAFEFAGDDAVYVPLRVEPGAQNFNRFVDATLQRLWTDLAGLSVTIPHKESALARVGADNVDELARAIQAVNTIAFTGDADRPLRGINTDYAAAIDALVETMGCTREDLTGRRVAVLGAGGAARAIVAALAYYGAEVTVYNRTVRRGERLAAEFGDAYSGSVSAEGLDALADLSAEIVINCTPLGMHPKVEGCPLSDDAKLSADTVVFDTIYNPIQTRLLARATAAGCKTVTGLTMFVNQAVSQYEFWTGRTAPREVMREVVTQRLGRR